MVYIKGSIIYHVIISKFGDLVIKNVFANRPFKIMLVPNETHCNAAMVSPCW